MKFATFTTSNNKLPRYGFKKGNYIVDILHLSKFLKKKIRTKDLLIFHHHSRAV